MQLVALSTRTTSDSDLHQFERLVSTLSSTLASLPLDELAHALKHTLGQVCLVLNVDRSSVVEFNENSGIRSCHSQDRPGMDAIRIEPDASEWTWLVGRLRDGQAVPVSRLEDCPME